MPTHTKYVLGGASPEDLSRCILLYASYNNDLVHRTAYPERALNILEDLKTAGYKGHVLVRIGGYPLIDKGGIKLAHVPYSFKVLSLIEASTLGYQDVLWLDCAAHPTNDLSGVFDCINKTGFFLLANGINLDYDYNFGILPDKALANSDLSPKELSSIPHIIATIFGVSFKTAAQHDFIDEWYRLTALVSPAMTLYPEEFLISVAAWRTEKRASGHVGHYLDVRSVTPNKPVNGKKSFWFDKG